MVWFSLVPLVCDNFHTHALPLKQENLYVHHLQVNINNRQYIHLILKTRISWWVFTPLESWGFFLPLSNVLLLFSCLKEIDTLIDGLNQSSIYLTSNKQLQSCHFIYQLIWRIKLCLWSLPLLIFHHNLKSEHEAECQVFFSGDNVQCIPLHRMT